MNNQVQNIMQPPHIFDLQAGNIIPGLSAFNESADLAFFHRKR